MAPLISAFTVLEHILLEAQPFMIFCFSPEITGRKKKLMLVCFSTTKTTKNQTLWAAEICGAELDV